MLSVAAQQIAVVLQCKKERKSKFIFTDGDEVIHNTRTTRYVIPNPLTVLNRFNCEKLIFATTAHTQQQELLVYNIKLVPTSFLYIRFP